MTSKAANAYKKVANTISNPRDIEASLLLHAALRLQAVSDGGADGTSELDDALQYNRKLWTILVTSVTDPQNPLPAEIRQNVANLGLFVLTHTLSILAAPAPDKLGTLIGINRNVAAGLQARA